MSARRSAWTGGAVGIAALIGAWSLLATTVFGSGDGVPTPWAVVASVYDDGWTFYSPHVTQTVGEALTGYLVGNGLALGLAVLVLLVPVLERVVTQIAVASYCLPIVAIGPILSSSWTETSRCRRWPGCRSSSPPSSARSSDCARPTPPRWTSYVPTVAAAGSRCCGSA